MAYSMGKGQKKTDLGNYILMNFECTPVAMKRMNTLMEKLQKEQVLLPLPLLLLLLLLSFTISITITIRIIIIIIIVVVL